MKHIFLGLAVFMVAALAIGGGIFYDATPSNYINGSGVAAGDVDLNGNDLICDADADSKLVIADDSIGFTINGASDFVVSPNSFTAVAGSYIYADNIGDTSGNGITIAEAILGVKQFRHAYPSSLTTAGTAITADLSVSDVINIDLEGASGNVTVTVSNANAGESFALIITQGIVARTVTVTGATQPGAAGSTFSISAVNNQVDMISCIAISNAAFMCPGFMQNFQ